MLDLDSDQQEVDLADDDVFQVVSGLRQRSCSLREQAYVLGLIVLELDVQAILNADFHFDRVVAVWRHAVGMYPNVPLLGHPSDSS